MAALENTGRRYVKSNCMCTYASIIIHGTASPVLHIAIEMQIAFFFLLSSPPLVVVCVFFLIVVNQPRLKKKRRAREGMLSWSMKYTCVYCTELSIFSYLDGNLER